MEDCLFCKIIAGKMPSKKVYEDEKVLAFHDISPQAPIHILVIPKEHISGIDKITPENSSIVAHISEVIVKIANDLKLEKGFRVVTNVGEDGCQSVKHMHFHILAGRQLAAVMC